MPNTYTINFNNQSNSDNTYAFFVNAPVDNPTPGEGGYFSNVWISQFVPNGGFFDITTTDQFYAWTGSAPQTIAPGVVVSAGEGKPATLATVNDKGSDFPMTTEQGAAMFLPDLDDNTTSGSFEIKTDKSFNDGDNYLVGLGQLDNSNQIVPVATVAAEPGMGYTLSPIVKYYVAVSLDVQGTVVDINAGSLNPGTIDFTDGPGQGNTIANVTVDSSNNFAVTFAP